MILYVTLLQLSVASLLVTGLYLLAPRLALGGVLFGVTVPGGFAASESGRDIIRRYRLHVLLAGAVGLLGVLAGAAVAPPFASSGALLLGAALSTAAWLAARARTQPHAVAPSPVRRAGLAAEPPGPSRWLELVPFALLALAGLALAAGWDRLPERFPVPSPVTGDGTPDDCWKAGLFYVNPDDPAVFVPKRTGLGYTINFGRPAGWAALVALLLVPLAIVLVTGFLAR